MQVSVSFNAEISSFSPLLRNAILEHLARELGSRVDGIQVSEGAQAKDEPLASDAAFPAELSVAQADEFLNACSEKTRGVVRAMVTGSSSTFSYADIIQATGGSARDLDGVWGGMTRRTRTVLRDKSARLIFWSGYERDEDRHLEDATGRISETTLRSFRIIFKLES